MNAENLVKKLARLYSSAVQIRSPYHIQVLSDKGPHDIWLKKDGSLKFKRGGDNLVEDNISLDLILKKIGSKAKTKVETMHDVLDFALMIKEAERTALALGRSGIFTDAGYKDGKARIAAILVDGDEITAKSKSSVEKDTPIMNIQDAEMAAINLGLSMHPMLTVFNDNKVVCDCLKSTNPRVQWLPRDFMKAPDKLANFRS